jgi:thiol-disulfide isomerase/thioredoxin
MDRDDWTFVVLAMLVILLLSYKVYEPFTGERVIEPVGSDMARLTFFNTVWCGHCKKAKPEWGTLVSGKKTFGDTQVDFISVDCDQDKKTCDNYSIKAYPTIVLETHDGLTRYEGKVTAKDLTSFLEKTLGGKK